MSISQKLLQVCLFTFLHYQLATFAKLSAFCIDVKCSCLATFWSYSPDYAKQAVHLVAGEGLEAYLPLADMVDVSAEVQRLSKRITKMQSEYDALVARLNSPSVWASFSITSLILAIAHYSRLYNSFVFSFFNFASMLRVCQCPDLIKHQARILGGAVHVCTLFRQGWFP